MTSIEDKQRRYNIQIKEAPEEKKSEQGNETNANSII